MPLQFSELVKAIQKSFEINAPEDLANILGVAADTLGTFIPVIGPAAKIAIQVGKAIKEKFTDPKEERRQAFLLALRTTYFNTFNQALERLSITFLIVDAEDFCTAIFQHASQDFDVASLDPNDTHSSPFIQGLQKSYERQLTEGGIEANDQAKIFRYISTYFNAHFFELIEEDEKQKFSLLTNYLNSKQAEEYRTIYLRKRYEQHLMAMFESDAVFQNENLSLKKLYVPPHFSMHKNTVEPEQWREFRSWKYPNSHDEYFPRQENLDDCILSILQNGQDAKPYLKPDLSNKRSRFLLILGSPGQGKSSLCKRLMYKILTGEQALKQDIFFVRMRYITDIQGLRTAPLTTLLQAAQEQSHHTPGYTINKNTFERSLLILDGFDELSMASNMETQESLRFCSNLIEALDYKTELKIILTSRLGRIAPQDIQAGQEKVNFFLMQPFNQSQQEQWLQNYKRYKFTPLTHKHIADYHQNRDDSYTHILELLGQPLLLHIIATLKEAVLSGIEKNKAAIYDKLFEELIARNYDSGTISIYQDNGVDKAKLRKIIQELAFAIFQSGQDFIHKDKVLSIELIAQILRKLHSDQDVEALFKGLMVSFYLNESLHTKTDKLGNTTNDFAIEFLHKSLQEYMTAEKVWRTIRSGLTATTTIDEETHYRLEKPEEILALCSELFAQRFFTKEIGSNIEEIIANDPDNDKKALVFQRLKDFFPTVLKRGFFSKNDNSTVSPIHQSLNGFVGYSTLLGALANGENFIDEKIKDLFAEYLRIWGASLPVLSNCHCFNLTGQDLSNTYLSGANLSNFRLSRSNLSDTDLYRALLNHADMSKAIMNRTYLLQATMMMADLNGANLSDADLSSTESASANLSKADLSRARLSGAYLSNGDLSYANLTHAYLTSAYLTSVDLSNANLTCTDFSRAMLFGANLSHTNLTLARLEDADLTDADLTDADLRNTEFIKVILQKATMHNVKNLSPEFRQEAQRQGALLDDDSPTSSEQQD